MSYNKNIRGRYFGIPLYQINRDVYYGSQIKNLIIFVYSRIIIIKGGRYERNQASPLSPILSWYTYDLAFWHRSSRSRSTAA